MAKHKDKKKHSNKGMIAFIILSLIIFFTPSAYSWYTAKHQEHNLIEYANSKEKDTKEYHAYREYNKFIEANQGHVPIKEYYNQARKVGIKDGQTIGYMNIPNIGVKNMPIMFGDSYDTLARGTGTLPFTSLPMNAKNTLAAVTGHTGMANQIFFDNIKFLKKGDVIKTNVLGKDINYKVTGMKVIDPNKPEADHHFFIQKGKKMIALMTCTPVFINSHRLIVYGEYVTPKEAARIPTKPYRAFWSVDHIFMLIVLIIFIIIMLATWLLSRKAKKQEKIVE